MEPEEYRKMAAVEDVMWYYRALHRHVGRSLAARLPRAGAGVLDAGCGTGGLLRHLGATHPGWRLSGLELSPLACTLARERTAAVVVEGTVTSLPFPDGTFDAVVSCDVLCQVPDALAALREFGRGLRPAGIVVLTLPAYPWMYSYHDREVGNLRRYTRGQVAELVRAAGLVVRTNTYWNALPFPLAAARRKIFPPAAGTSDVRLFPAPVEAGFNALMALEHAWLGSGGRLPFGSSVLTVAQKP